MKVSKKEYRFRQNAATGSLFMFLIAVCIYAVKLCSDWGEIDWFFNKDMLWLLLAVSSFTVWRWREKNLKKLEIDDK